MLDTLNCMFVYVLPKSPTVTDSSCVCIFDSESDLERAGGAGNNLRRYLHRSPACLVP